MALEGNENMVMPVSPMGGGFGNAGFGNDGWWIILLFVLLGGWGGGFGGYGNGGVVQVDNSVQRGFDQANIMSGLGDIQSSIVSTQLADLQQNFALQSQLASCCCENRLATADLKYTVATENCQDRFALAESTRDIIDSQNRGTQALLDKICQLELDAKNDRIVELERQLTAANFVASQTAQTAEILSRLPAQTTTASA